VGGIPAPVSVTEIIKYCPGDVPRFAAA
jgi:hypothetical protein